MNTINNEQIKAAIVKQFADQVANFKYTYDMLSFNLENKELLYDLINFLKNDEALQFQFLTTLCGAHYPKNKTIAVIYHLHNLYSKKRIRFRVNLGQEQPILNSIVPLFPGANWMEREAYDFYGVIFKGHPNLKRILNMEDLQAFPMRKEYPLEDPNKIDKNDAQFGR